MNNSVRNSLIGVSIIISIATILCFGLIYLCEGIPYESIEIITKIIISLILAIFDLVVFFSFLLYWWSEVKWDSCKRKFHNIKKRIR